MIPKSHSVDPLPFCRGVEPPTKFSKRGRDLTGPQLLEGVAGKKGDDFFQGGAGLDILLIYKGGLARKKKVVFLRGG